MTSQPPSNPVLAAAEAFFGSPRFASALTTVSIGMSVMAFALQRTIGWAGLLAILVTLVALAAVSFVARREIIQWQGILPISLLVFLGWVTLSVLWSEYQWSTVGGIAYLGAYTVLGLYIALTRDTIQIVRAFGDVLRVILATSLVLEILAGVLIDTPIRFLSIDGNLDVLGPIQGIMGSRNQLGVLAVIAAITFGTEFRTKSVQRGVGIGSLVLAGVCILLSRSPIITGVLLVVAAAAAALYGLRRVPQERRTFWQLSLLGAVVVAGIVAWLTRGRIVEALNAGGELNYRLNLWNRIWDQVALNPLEGWGWVGPWRPEVQPFPLFANPDGHVPNGALNAYLDVWFQLGLVGIVLFVGLVGLAFVRSWLLAGRRRSFVFAWPALVLVALVTTSLAESLILTQYGWLTFVVCCVKAAGELSWRRAFQTPLVQDTEGLDLGKR